MTPEEKAKELTAQYGDKALEVCETIDGALMWDYSSNGNPRQVATDKPVLLVLRYESYI